MQSDPILDVGFLRQQTFGDRELERELLVLFQAQCERLLPVAIEAGGGASAIAAHTLVGAARAVGAGRLAAAASGLDAALSGVVPEAGDAAGWAQTLRRAAEETMPAVASLLER